MLFNHYTALFAAFCGTALSHSGTHLSESSVDLSEPSSHISQPSITHPSKGDLIQAGSIQQIKWQSTSNQTGSVQVLLQNKDSGDYTGFVELLSHDVKNSAGHLRWKVNANLPSGDKYYIRIAAVDDAADPNDSDLFQIKAAKNSTHSSSARVGSATTLVTGSTTATASVTASGSATASDSASTSGSATASGSTTPSATGTSTSTAGGSMATSFVSGPLALVGAVAVGMFAL